MRSVSQRIAAAALLLLLHIRIGYSSRTTRLENILSHLFHCETKLFLQETTVVLKELLTITVTHIVFVEFKKAAYQLWCRMRHMRMEGPHELANGQSPFGNRGGGLGVVTKGTGGVVGWCVSGG